MLFYEREEKSHNTETLSSVGEMDPELSSWIWKDNIQFIRDKQIFDLTYYNFMWILCSKVAPTFTESSQTSLSNVKLATSFLLETFIHSKEKPGLKGWSDLLVVHFDNSRDACGWFLDHMAQDNWWLHQILLRCPVQATRQVSCHGNIFIVVPAVGFLCCIVMLIIVALHLGVCSIVSACHSHPATFSSGALLFFTKRVSSSTNMCKSQNYH
jgi:hypothetical protein